MVAYEECRTGVDEIRNGEDALQEVVHERREIDRCEVELAQDLDDLEELDERRSEIH